MASPAPTLDGRLLCAADCTYFIQGSAFNPDDAQPYFDGAGWQGTPQVIVGGIDQINACLVGNTQDGTVLAFRGTLPPSIHNIASLIDWMEDFNAMPEAESGLPSTVKVHTGFWSDLMTIWGQIANAIQSRTPLYITGHSKGGALASLSALAFAEAFQGATKITAAAVHTFASPRTGDTGFATLYSQLFPTNAVRWEYQDDLVPHLPPTALFIDILSKLPIVGKYFRQWTTWDYTSVGSLRFINWSGQIVGDSFTLAVERMAHLAELVFEGKLSVIAADHSALCGSGYMTAIAPTGVCPVATRQLMASILASRPELTASGAECTHGLGAPA
jgi:hypothetical protein